MESTGYFVGVEPEIKFSGSSEKKNDSKTVYNVTMYVKTNRQK